MLVENIVRSKEGNHEEQDILLLVEEGQGREGSRQEVYCRGWGARVEAL